MPTSETISLLDIIWIPSGIAACAIFTWTQRHTFSGVYFEDAFIFSLALFFCFMFGPVSLTLLSLALLITFFSNR